MFASGLVSDFPFYFTCFSSIAIYVSDVSAGVRSHLPHMLFACISIFPLERWTYLHFHGIFFERGERTFLQFNLEFIIFIILSVVWAVKIQKLSLGNSNFSLYFVFLCFFKRKKTHTHIRWFADYYPRDMGNHKRINWLKEHFFLEFYF